MNRLKLHKIAIASLICLVAATACQREALPADSATGSIKANVSATNPGTKSSCSDGEELSQTIVMGEDNLLLKEFVSDNQSQPLAGKPVTKGTIITTGNIATEYGLFVIDAFLDNYGDTDTPLTNGDQYINGGLTEYEGGSWNLTDGSDPYPWLTDIHFTFWSYAPKTHPGTYAYGATGSRNVMSVTGFVNPSAAGDQSDILMAYNNRWYNSANSSETIDIRFRHALAAINFDASALTGFTVKKIEISGAYSKGSCIITGGDLADADVTKAFVWTPASDTGTFVMEGAADNFFMIPQALPSTAKIRITMEKDGEVITREESLTTTWLAGKRYRYVLTYDPADYVFSILESDAAQEFDNTDSDSEEVVIPVSSIKTKESETDDSWDWTIKSYQIGSGTPVEVNGTSFTNGGGYNVSKDGNNLKIKSLARTAAQEGSHAYWVNEGGLSGDTDGSGWSPLDWSTSRATASAPLDLSKFDFRTESGIAMTTANCYVIRHAGTYKIPLVYGNGIVNGMVNEESYYPDATGGTCRLDRFVNHKGNGITSPFIENNDGCIANDCEIVWQDEAVVIKNLSIVDGTGAGVSAGNYDAGHVRYLQFTVDASTVCQNNALIAVKDADGNIIWSWNIWTTNDPALLSNPIAVTNYSGNVYNFFPLPAIGFVDGENYPAREQVVITLVQASSGNTIEITVDEPEVRGPAMANFYQFGRKDPMCNTDTPASGSHSVTTGMVDLKTAIQNPGTFFSWYEESEYGGNWCSTVYNNLWSGKISTDGNGGLIEDGADLIKTVYDPSPVGYKMPASNAFTGFTTDGKNSDSGSHPEVNARGGYNNGWNYYTSLGPGNTVNTGGPTIYFPGLGSRYCDTGEIDIDPDFGIFWSAIPYNHVSGWDMGIGKDAEYFPDGLVHTQYNNSRSDAYSVRPVLEYSSVPSSSSIKNWKTSDGYDL